jgi:hypothetical protein
MEAKNAETSHALLDADLNAPDLYGILPFGGTLRAMDARTAHAELDADLNASGSLWGIW